VTVIKSEIKFIEIQGNGQCSSNKNRLGS